MGGKPQRFPGHFLGNTRDLKEDPSGLHDGHPILGRAFAAAQANTRANSFR